MGKAKFSQFDSRGMLHVDCTECKRGFYGDKSCSCGSKNKKAHTGACFIGVLIEHLELPTKGEN